MSQQRPSRTAVILTAQDLAYGSRVFKQADALHAAGFRVLVFGMMMRSGESREEAHGFGRVVRVRTTDNLHAESASESSPRPETGVTGSYLRGVRMFLGRVRENHLIARAAAGAKPDVVIASDLTAWIAGYLSKRWSRAPLILDVRDLALDSGRPYPSVFVSLYRRVERFVVRKADAVTTASPLFVDVIRERYPALSVPVVSIYSGAFECAGRARPPHRPLRLFFQGNYMPNRRLDELMEGVARATDVDVTLTLQGFGAEENRLRNLAVELGAAARIRFISPCDVRDVVKSASDYDVGVINYRGDTLNLRMTTPIKLIDYMAAGLAVMASDLPGIRQIVEKEHCGILFEPTGPDAIAAAVRALAADPDAIATMKANSVSACAGYSAAVQGVRLVGVVESVIGGEPDAFQ